MSRNTGFSSLCLGAFAVAWLVGCSGGSSAPPTISLSGPATVTLDEGGSEIFKASIANDAMASLNWTISGNCGPAGNSPCGSLSGPTQGVLQVMYVAPALPGGAVKRRLAARPDLQLLGDVDVIVATATPATTPITSKSITITVDPPPSIVTPPAQSAMVASQYSFTFAVAANTGAPPFTWSLSNNPSWLSIASSSGTVTGTPPQSAANTTVNYTVNVSDSNSPTPGSKSLATSLTVNPTALAITTTSLQSATVDAAYSETLMASGGTPPYTWSISAGSLPAGLSLDVSTGAITGTPPTAGTSNFTVKVVDSSSTPMSLTASLSITISTTAVSCVLSGKQFAIELTGEDSTGPAVMLGSTTVAADGSLTGALDFRNQTTLSANLSISGAAGSCKNGTVANTGTLTFTAGGMARTLDFAMRADDTFGHVVDKGSSGFSGAGEIQLQDAPTASLEGSRAFGLEGFSPNTEAFSIGAVCLDSQFSISFLQADFAVNLMEINMVTGSAGTFSAPDANGRSETTSAVTYSNGTMLENTAYIVNGHEAFMMVSSGTAPGLGALPPMAGFLSGVPGSSCLATGQGGSFSNSSLIPSTFSAGGVSGSGGTLNGTGFFSGAVLSVNSAAGTLTFEDDQNVAGVSGTTGVLSATYSIPSNNNGRGTITTLDSQNRPSVHEFYLDGNGNAYIILGDHKGEGIAFGAVLQRSASTLTPGIYAFGTQVRALNAPVLSVTQVQITGTTITDLTPGGSTGSYSCDPTGRCTAPSLSNSVTFGDTSVVFYINGNADSSATESRIDVLQLTSTTPVGGSLEQ